MSDFLINRAKGYNVPAPGANTNILASSLTPKKGCAAFRLTIVLAANSVFNVTTTDGTTVFTSALNDGGSLTAGRIYTFVFGVSGDLAYNFQVATNGVIRVLQVDEVQLGVL